MNKDAILKSALFIGSTIGMFGNAALFYLISGFSYEIKEAMAFVYSIVLIFLILNALLNPLSIVLILISLRKRKE